MEYGQNLKSMGPVSPAADRRQVTDVWRNGKRLLQDRVLQTLDVEKIKRNAAAWGKKLAG